MGVSDEAIISDRGGKNPRRLPIANPSCSWELNTAGSFSAFARIRDLRAAGLGHDLKGRWLEWEHPTAGRWGGVLSGRPVEDGVAELAADGWAKLLSGRVLAEQDTPPPGPIGGLIRRLVIAAGRDDPTFIKLGVIDEGGPSIQIDTGGGDIGDDLLPQLAQDGGAEWYVDADRRINVARKLGRDRSATVRLVEDRHVTNFRLDDDLWSSVRGQVFVIESPAATTARAAQAVAGAAFAPIQHFTPQPWLVLMSEVTFKGSNTGLLQFVVPAGPTDLGAVTQSLDVGGGGASVITTAAASDPTVTIPPWPWAALGVPQPSWWVAYWTARQRPSSGGTGGTAGGGSATPAAPNAARFAPLPTVPIELTVADADHCWASFDVGDTIRVELGSVGFAGRVRVSVKALDSAAGELTVSGEALED